LNPETNPFDSDVLEVECTRDVSPTHYAGAPKKATAFLFFEILPDKE
jgi:hypothetical protein